MRVDFDVFGDQQISREILRVGKNADDARPVWRSIVSDLLAINDRQFTTRGGRSHKWAPLALSTVEAKRRHRRRRGILESTGALRRAATLRDDPGRETILHPAWMVFRITVPYARHHQLGARHLPQRRVVDLTERDRTLLLKKVQRWIITGEISGSAGFRGAS